MSSMRLSHLSQRRVGSQRLGSRTAPNNPLPNLPQRRMTDWPLPSARSCAKSRSRRLLGRHRRKRKRWAQAIGGLERETLIGCTLKSNENACWVWESLVVWIFVIPYTWEQSWCHHMGLQFLILFVQQQIYHQIYLLPSDDLFIFFNLQAAEAGCWFVHLPHRAVSDQAANQH